MCGAQAGEAGRGSGGEVEKKHSSVKEAALQLASDLNQKVKLSSYSLIWLTWTLELQIGRSQRPGSLLQAKATAIRQLMGE